MCIRARAASAASRIGSRSRLRNTAVSVTGIVLCVRISREEASYADPRAPTASAPRLRHRLQHGRRTLQPGHHPRRCCLAPGLDTGKHGPERIGGGAKLSPRHASLAGKDQRCCRWLLATLLATRAIPARRGNRSNALERLETYAGGGSRTLMPPEGTPDFKSGAFDRFRHPGARPMLARGD